MTALADHIQQTPLVDSHEHLHDEDHFLATPHDVLQQLFDGGYIAADLVVAGATSDAVRRLVDVRDADVAGRFAPVFKAWQRCQFTGYGEVVRIIARDAYGVDELTPESLAEAQHRHGGAHEPGQRLRILREQANLDHVQIDQFALQLAPDPAGPDFFLHDISWAELAHGLVMLNRLRAATGVEVRDLASLRRACAAIFERYGPFAVAVKSQHAYMRTLKWRPRSDSDAAAVLQRYLSGALLDDEDRLVLGDWCLAVGAELCGEHDLPLKLHTGYHAGHSGMQLDWVHPEHLSPLIKEHRRTRFVLMHAGYPFGDELLALAKHYPNVYVDLCWAWTIDPRTTTEFVRRFIHAVPTNKLFAFGGDTLWPLGAVAYARQARAGLTAALEAEVADGCLTEGQAMQLASQFMRDNQYACMNLEAKRAALRDAPGA